MEGISDWSSAGRSAAALARCFQELSGEQRRGIELAFVNGYSHADIARVTGEPLGTIKSWIRRGLASLRRVSGDMKHDQPGLIDALAAEYVLGTLRGAARRRFERWQRDEWHVEPACEPGRARLIPLAMG